MTQKFYNTSGFIKYLTKKHDKYIINNAFVVIILFSLTKKRGVLE